MAYDEDLAHRIRELLAAEPDVREKRMFGGLSFLIEGRMAVGVSGRGGLMARMDPEETDTLLGEPHARPFEMRGKPLDGWLRVDADGLETDAQLTLWIRRGVDYARSLPAE